MKDRAEFDVRESRASDKPALERLYPQAFPDEDLLPLVRKLLADPAVVSLVAESNGQPAGHAAFTRCGIAGSDAVAGLLGPLAVAPAFQRRGVGRGLVLDGLRRMSETGVATTCVLGDPGYYGRLGFTAETAIEPPYALPDAWAGAWQSQRLAGAGNDIAGRLVVPSPWRDPALWAP